MLSLHGSAHLSEQLAGEKNGNPQRHQVGRRNQDDKPSSSDSISSQNADDFFNRPHPFDGTATACREVIRFLGMAFWANSFLPDASSNDGTTALFPTSHGIGSFLHGP